MEQYVFKRLNEDDVLELLKYMPIKELVRFERINSDWARSLEGLWTRQQRLEIGRSAGELKCHLFGLNGRYQHSNMQVEVMLKVIGRCKNLKALELYGNAFEGHSTIDSGVATQLATVLHGNCKLEHITLFKPNTTALRLLFENYRNLVSLKLASWSGQDVAILSKFGPTLRKLDLSFPSIGMLSSYDFWQNLSKLTKLRWLSIHAVSYDDEGYCSARANVKLNANGVILLLNSCKKLKYFRISCMSYAKSIITASEKTEIRKAIALKSCRHQFVVNFESSKWGGHSITVQLGQ